MAVQHFVCDRSQCINHERSNGDVWDKAAVHNIDVHPVTTSFVYCLDLRKARFEVVGGVFLTRSTSLPRLAKSAERIEGATITSVFLLLSTRAVASTTKRPRALRRLCSDGALRHAEERQKVDISPDDAVLM